MAKFIIYRDSAIRKSSILTVNENNRKLRMNNKKFRLLEYRLTSNGAVTMVTAPLLYAGLIMMILQMGIPVSFALCL